MDPLQALLGYLRERLRDQLPDETVAAIERKVNDLFAKFELVPRHQYEAHLDILASLEAQVQSLEQRLAALEATA